MCEQAILTNRRKCHRQNWFLINRFKTVIFNLVYTDNTRDNLLGMFSLLLTVISSEAHQIREKEKLNCRRNDNSKKLSK